MSKHIATESTKNKALEAFACQMARVYGRKSPLPGNGSRRADNTGQAAK